MRKKRLARLLFAPGMAMIGTAFGTIPGALAQTSFTSFTPPPRNNNTTTTTTQGGSSLDTTVAATTQGVARAQGNAITGSIQSHLRDIVRSIVRGTLRGDAGDGKTGLSAGSGPARFGAWVDSSGSYQDNTAGGSFSYSGWAQTHVAGLDATFGDSWVAGVSAGYTGSDFNVPSLAGGRRRNDGYFVGPYLSYIIGQHYSVDGSFQVTDLSNDVTNLTTTPSNIRHFGSTRYTGAINANYYRDIGPISFVGFTGYTYSLEHQRGFADSTGAQFTSTNVRYGAWKLGFEVSYPLGDLEPYIPFTFEHQTTQVVDGTSENGVQLGIGLRYRIGDAIKLGIAFGAETARDHLSEETIGGNIRISF